MNTFVSITARVRLAGIYLASERKYSMCGGLYQEPQYARRRQSVPQYVSEDFLCQPPFSGLCAHAFAELLKPCNVRFANTVVFFSGHDDRHIAVLAADQDRLPLGGIQQRGQALFSISS